MRKIQVVGYDTPNQAMNLALKACSERPKMKYNFTSTGILVDSCNAMSFQKDWWNKNISAKLDGMRLRAVETYNKYFIQPHAIRKPGNEFFIFVPFDENGVVEQVDCDTIEKMNSYAYGMFITDAPNAGKKTINETQGSYPCSGRLSFLNAGILIEQATLNTIFGIEMRIYSSESETAYNNIVFNFPPDWVKLDMSRERLLGFDDKIDKNDIAVKIAKTILLPLFRLRNHETQGIRLVNLQEISRFIIALCTTIFAKGGLSEIRESLETMKYIMQIDFSKEGIQYSLKQDINRSGKDFIKLLQDATPLRAQASSRLRELGSSGDLLFDYTEESFLRKIEGTLAAKKIESLEEFDSKFAEQFAIIDPPNNLTMMLFSIYLLMFNENKPPKKDKASHSWLSLEGQFMKRYTSVDFLKSKCVNNIPYGDIENFVKTYIVKSNRPQA